jgi:hypothetical protein
MVRAARRVRSADRILAINASACAYVKFIYGMICSASIRAIVLHPDLAGVHAVPAQSLGAAAPAYLSSLR